MSGTVKLVDQSAGIGQLIREGQVISEVGYRVSVYQGMLGDSGLPVPGLRTLKGSLDFHGPRGLRDLVGATLVLKLEDGRQLGITLTDADGCIAERGQHASTGCC